MRTINRRDSLKIIGATVAAPAIARSALAAPAPLPPLTLPDRDAELLRPGSPPFKDTLTSSNRRTMQTPQLRALCKTPNGVATMVNWARDNHLPFALRAGGHSYEGFSESDSVVIDVRNMKDVTFDPVKQTMTVGAGAALGPIYDKIGKANFGFPGGSCPTVGITGHALGGGYGFFSRPYGLACDSLQWAQLVNAKGQLIEADAQQNRDLFWALRGGGGGSFGAVTQMRFAIHPISSVLIFSMSWTLTLPQAVKLMQAYQAWAPHAPSAITALLHINHNTQTTVSLGCSGLTTGSPAQLRSELKHLTAVFTPSRSRMKPGNFLAAVDFFGPIKKYISRFFKAESDYVKAPLSADGIATLVSGVMQRPGVSALCDCYGGKIAEVASDATAFPHRAGTLFSIQYLVYWDDEAKTHTMVDSMRALYKSMRPYVSGSAYFNYCDLDLGDDYATRYWGANLPRLKQIKKAFDPDNVFRHRQSVPLV